MKPLEQTFTKNGIDYDTVKRTEKVALFRLFLDGTLVGYEVSRIYQNPERTMAGHVIQATESISGNEQFGTDGSKAFFPDHFTRAEDYFLELNAELDAKCVENAIINNA
jgi:hypothetical protein